MYVLRVENVSTIIQFWPDNLRLPSDKYLIIISHKQNINKRHNVYI